jgi:flagellar protein FlgJ
MTQILPAQGAAQAAQAFEANALGELFEPMFETVDTADGPFGGGIGESTFRPMLTHAIAEAVAAHGGLGLAAPVLQQMLQMQETVKMR